jgi:hypothetical protein
MQLGSGRLCAQERSLVPLVKTRDFGMTPEKSHSLKIFKLSRYRLTRDGQSALTCYFPKIG